VAKRTRKFRRRDTPVAKNETKQNKTKQNKTKQNKTKRNKTKQNKTKQNKKNQIYGLSPARPKCNYLSRHLEIPVD